MQKSAERKNLTPVICSRCT